MVGASSRVFAILGSPVSHSLSPMMHNAAFHALGQEAVYVALTCREEDLPGAMRLLAHAGGGGNVTIPHKERAAQVVTRPSERVKRLGACNTFWGEDGEIVGDNTDIDGVTAALDRLEAPASGWLIAGTGGAARSIVAAAAERRAAVAIRSRDAARKTRFEAWARGLGVELTEPASCQVLINATPLGLHPGDHLPIAIDDAPGAVAALDLVYARHETPWVRTMRQSGLRAADGRVMLVAQGAAAFRRWFPEEEPATEIMRAVVDDALR